MALMQLLKAGRCQRNEGAKPVFSAEGAAFSSSLGQRRLYDVLVLSDGRISLQLVGSLEGAIPTDAAGIGERVAASRSEPGEGGRA